MFAAPVHADTTYSIGISPDKLRLDLAPDSVYEGQYLVFNNGDTPYDFEVIAVPYGKTSDPDIYENDFFTETNYNKIAQWISLDTSTFHLEPKSEVTVDFAITVPKNAAGGQYAALVNRITSGESSGISAVNQIGLIIYSTIDGDINHCGELTAIDIPFWQSEALTASATIKNCGNTDFRPKISYKIESLFGGTLYDNAAAADDSFLMPESEHKIMAKWDDPKWANRPWIGAFWVSQTVKFLDHDTTTRSFVIICPQWALIVIILALSGLIIGIFLSIRAKKHKRETAP
jgi:hypothetical protein